MSALDRLARALAEPVSRESTTRMTRGELARRGGLVVLSLGALGQLALPRHASAARAPCRSLAACLSASNQAGSDAYQACVARNRRAGASLLDEFRDLDCRLWDGPEAARKAQRKCFAQCPPPKAPRKPPSRSRRGKQEIPPALPPNPYDNVAWECANCGSVGGACCGGSAGQDYGGGLCACATAGVPCHVYGC